MSLEEVVKSLKSIRESVKARNMTLVTFDNVVKVKMILHSFPSSQSSPTFEKNEHNYYVEVGKWLPPGYYHKSEKLFIRLHGEEEGKQLYESEHLHDEQYFLFYYNEDEIVRSDSKTFKWPDDSQLKDIYSSELMQDLQTILDLVSRDDYYEPSEETLLERLAELETV